MRTIAIISLLLLPLALPAQTIVTGLGENGWGAYPAYITASSYSFDFADMAGTTDGALTITTNGVADIASKGISGTALSSFAGATYRWESSTWSVSLKLDVRIFGKISIGSLVYNPGLAPTDWTTTTIGADSKWRFTSSTDIDRTLSDWASYIRGKYYGLSPTIGAIELGLGTSKPVGNYTGSIDWLDYSVRSSSGAVTTTTVDFAAPIPEPATTAALVAIGGLGVALVARRRKQRQ